MTPEEIKAMHDKIAVLENDKKKLEEEKASWEAKNQAPKREEEKGAQRDLLKEAFDNDKKATDQQAHQSYLKRSLEDTSKLKAFITSNLTAKEVNEINEKLKGFNDDPELEQEFLVYKILSMKDRSLDNADKVKAYRNGFGGKYTSETAEMSGIRTLIDGFMEQTNTAKSNRPSVITGYTGTIATTHQEAYEIGSLKTRQRFGFLGYAQPKESK